MEIGWECTYKFVRIGGFYTEFLLTCIKCVNIGYLVPFL